MLMEPGGVRTKFRYGNAKVAKLVPEYESCHGFLNMLEVSKGLAPGDPVNMAQGIIESAEKEPSIVRSAISRVSAVLLATRSRTRANISGIHTNTK